MLLPDVVAALRASCVDAIVAVEGAHPLDRADVPVARCPGWAQGPGASLRCGLAALPAACEAAVVVLADGPDLSPAAVDRVVEAWRAGGGDVVAASYGGARGHPLLVARAAWAAIPDEGLRVRSPQLVPCDDLGAPGDVDSPADLPERHRR